MWEIPIAGKGGKKGDVYAGKSLRTLGLNGAEGGSQSSLPDNINVVYVPTDKRFDMSGTSLHGATIITFTLPSLSSAVSSDAANTRYAVVYVPHGTTASSLQPWLAAHPDTQCLALIHGLDEVDNPWYLGKSLPPTFVMKQINTH